MDLLDKDLLTVLTSKLPTGTWPESSTLAIASLFWPVGLPMMIIYTRRTIKRLAIINNRIGVVLAYKEKDGGKVI
jgi:hypothetical protein